VCVGVCAAGHHQCDSSAVAQRQVARHC
jgi:hypothetical protein